MANDFERMIDRRNSDSLKWSRSRGGALIPLWVADMDFGAPECVTRALHARVSAGVFGYPIVTEPVNARRRGLGGKSLRLED